MKHAPKKCSSSTQPGLKSNALMLQTELLESHCTLTPEADRILSSIPHVYAPYQARRGAWLAVIEYVRLHGIAGTVLRDSDDTKWAMLTPDVTPGMHRYTCFDQRGFFAHGTYHTAEEALIAVFDMGYRYVDDPQKLTKIAPFWPLIEAGW